MDIERIKEILYRYYDIDEDYGDEEKGCFVSGKWLSVENVLQIIERWY